MLSESSTAGTTGTASLLTGLSLSLCPELSPCAASPCHTESASVAKAYLHLFTRSCLSDTFTTFSLLVLLIRQPIGTVYAVMRFKRTKLGPKLQTEQEFSLVQFRSVCVSSASASLSTQQFRPWQ